MALAGNPLEAPLGEDLDYLIRTLRRRQVGVIDRLLADMDLPLSAWYPLVILNRGDGLSQRELANLINLKDAAMGKSVDSLARAGLVERAIDKGDGRKSIVILTRKGRDVARKIARARGNLINGMQKGFSANEREQFKRFLARAYKNLCAMEQ